MFYFVFIELIFLDKEERIFITPKYYLPDYIYKVLFKYHLEEFLMLIILISNFTKELIYNFIINYVDVNISAINLAFIILSILFYIDIVKRVLTNRFNTYSLFEIKNKMNTIKEFQGFRHDDNLEEFSKILTFYEDRSFFSRKNSYSIFSLEFLKYKYRIIKSKRKNAVYNYMIIGPILKYIIIYLDIIFQIIKRFIYELKIMIKKITAIITKKKKISSIRSIIRGHSTIEMQLIRTIALKDGYECTFQRKIYELIYSKVFFESLKNNFKYYKYNNIDEFKYYLIFIYILVAPTFINGKRYNQIYDLYKYIDNVLELSNEAFFIFTLGLANRYISKESINYYYCPVKLNKKRLLITYNEINNITDAYPDKIGTILNLSLLNYKTKKRVFVKIIFDYNKNLHDLINYIKKEYGEKDSTIYFNNLEEIILGNLIKEESLSMININQIIVENSYYKDLLKITMYELEQYCNTLNSTFDITYNVYLEFGKIVGEENGIKYEFHNNEKSIHAHQPHINCKNGSESIRINLLTIEVMDKKEFKSPVMTRRAKEYVKKHQDKLLDIWENVIDKNNSFNKKIKKAISIKE